MKLIATKNDLPTSVDEGEVLDTVIENFVQDEFSVLLKNLTEGVLHLSLYNTTGQLVWRQRFGNFSGTDLFIIPSSNLAPGNYWLKVNKDEDPEIIRRVIK